MTYTQAIMAEWAIAVPIFAVGVGIGWILRGRERAS
jgi:hypothetical protein